MDPLKPIGITDERLAQLKAITLSQTAVTFYQLDELRMVVDEVIWWRSFYGRFETRLARLEAAADKRA